MKIAYFFVLIALTILSVCNADTQQRPRILEHPADAIAAREEPLTINCKATGRPPPEITWYHNGTPLVPSERRVILPEGSLFFLRVMQNKREQDAGVYWCEAKSSAGLVVSRNATLQIAVLRDDFRSTPRDAIALVGGPVVLNCTPPRGIPEPSVLWYKDGKILDISGKRLSMVDSGSLMISEVLATDAGKYECSAQSMAGSKTAPPAILKVLAPPTVIKGPQDTEVIEGEGLDLPCELAGDPKPIVSWHRENGKLPDGRSRVLLDNTLRIEDTRPDDEGRYICKGFNEGGNVSVAIKLYVYAMPTFIEAPSDTEIREGETVNIPCRAQGRPKIRIIWDRVTYSHINSNHGSSAVTEEVSKFLDRDSHEEMLAKAKIMSLRSKRDLFSKNHRRRRRKRRDLEVLGTGPIPDLYVEDIHDRNQEEDQTQDFLVSEFETIMRDENEDSYDSKFLLKRRRKKRAAPNVVGGDDDERISGSDDELDGSDQTELVELSPPTPTIYLSTTVASEQQSLEVNEIGELIIRDANEKDQGWYACAALNEAGSVVKKIYIRVKTPSENEISQIPDIPGNRWGTEQNIAITSIIPMSATALDVSWETTDGIPSASLTLHYRPAGSDDFQTIRTEIDAKIYTLNDLKPHTEYEIFASVPHGLSGSVSNIRRGKTMDGPPSAPPTDVRVGVINNTAAYVRWSPPPTHLLNGELTGYKIQIKSNVTNKLLGQMSLNATTQSVVINSLSPGGRYIARVAPQTAGGLGPYSPPAPLHMDPSFIARPPKTDPASNGWSSAWMSGIALGILCLCLVGGAIFTVLWARRNKRNMKASYPAGPILTTTIPDKNNTLWLHGNPMVIKTTHTLGLSQQNQPPSEYAELQNVAPAHKINSTSTPPEPYATVTLKRNAASSQQSDDSCVKCSNSPSSCEYNAPPVTQREPINLCDILPPPPDHPYSAYKPPNNMTIRTNPAAMSPQIIRRIPPSPPRWGTLPPPIPNFPQNWMTQQRHHNPPQPNHHHLLMQQQNDLDSNNSDLYSENDYESGSILYEQFCRSQAQKMQQQQQPQDNSYFNPGGEPTEEYYRNVNMEFYDENYEPSTPPPPCPDSLSYSNNKLLNTNLRLLVNSQLTQQDRDGIKRNLNSFSNQTNTINSSGGSNSTTQSIHSSDDDDDSESDNNRWAPRPRRTRSRSKSSDRKYRNTNGVQMR